MAKLLDQRRCDRCGGTTEQFEKRISWMKCKVCGHVQHTINVVKYR